MSSQANPEPTGVPPLPVPPVSPEERAEWDALKARIADGDERGLIPWDDLAAELGLWGSRGRPLRRRATQFPP
jgi:hypothetical protein